MDLHTQQVHSYAYRTTGDRIARTARIARVEQTSDRVRMLSLCLCCHHPLAAYPVTILWQASCHLTAVPTPTPKPTCLKQLGGKQAGCERSGALPLRQPLALVEAEPGGGRQIA